MADQPEDTFEGDEGQENGPKQLREALKRKDERIKELETENTTLKTAERDRTLEQFIKDKGLPDKAKSLIGDTDPEEWYKQFGDLFAPEKQEGQGDEQQPEQQTALSPEQIAQMQAVNQVQPGQYQPQGDSETNAKLEDLFSGQKSETEIMEQLKAMGAVA